MGPQGSRCPLGGLATPGFHFPKGGRQTLGPLGGRPRLGGHICRGLCGLRSGCPHQPPAPRGGSAPVRSGRSEPQIPRLGAWGQPWLLPAGLREVGTGPRDTRDPRRTRQDGPSPGALECAWPCDPPLTSDARSPGLGGHTFLIFKPQLRALCYGWPSTSAQRVNCKSRWLIRIAHSGDMSSSTPCLALVGSSQRGTESSPTTSYRVQNLTCYSELSPLQRARCTRRASRSGS